MQEQDEQLSKPLGLPTGKKKNTHTQIRSKFFLLDLLISEDFYFILNICNDVCVGMGVGVGVGLGSSCTPPDFCFFFFPHIFVTIKNAITFDDSFQTVEFCLALPCRNYWIQGQ